jgi:LCP family protein required for cell wall assembly
VWAGVLLGMLALVLVGAAVAFAYVASTYREVSEEIAAPKAEQAAIVKVLEPVPKGEPVYLLLMGNDRRPGQGWARSDTVILVRLDPVLDTVSMISLPRDTYVAVPGHGNTKLTHASAYGGPALTIKTVSKLTGLPVNHYIQVDFDGFAAIVDDLGGIKMNVDRATTSPEGVHVPAGTRVLTGMQALAYVRNRKGYAGGDHQRMKNQQAFLYLLAKKAGKKKNFKRLPKILKSASAHMQTDLSVMEIMELAERYRGIKKSQMRSKSAPVAGKMIGGGSYQVLRESKFKDLLADFEVGGFEPRVEYAQNAGLK